MLSLFLRNLFFTILQPGLVAGLIPYWILGYKNIIVSKTLKFHHYSGGILFLAGLMIMLNCIIHFALEGRGTLSPLDPTKKLVTTGLYQFSRNPMYVGVIMILAGEAIFFQSLNLWIYVAFIFLAFNIFILLHEEPRLKKAFGEEYRFYLQNVRRWI